MDVRIVASPPGPLVRGPRIPGPPGIRFGTFAPVRGRPLSLIAAGLVLVGLDLRIVHIDVFPDPAGWLLVTLAAARLALRWPVVLGAVATVASLPDVALTYHYDDLDPLTGEVVVNGAGTGYDQRLNFDRITDVRAPLAILALVAGGLALCMVFVTLERRAGLLGDRRAATELVGARLVLLLAWVFPHLALMTLQWVGGDGLDPVWNKGQELVGMAGVAVVTALVAGAVVNRNRGWTATDDERRSPWAELQSAQGA